MKFRVEVIRINDDGAEQRYDVMELERHELAMETLGLSLMDGKTILHEVQDFVASQQMVEDLKARRICLSCGQRYHSKATGTHTLRPCSGRSACRIRGGSGVHARRQAQRHSGPPPGCMGGPVQSCSIWRRSGAR